MKSTDPTEVWLAHWRQWSEACRRTNPAAAAEALTEAGATFGRFAETYARFAAPAAAGADGALLAEELRSLTEQFVRSATGALPPFQAGAGSPPAFVRSAELLAGIARDAAARLAARLAGAAPPPSLRAAFDAWIDCAEAAFHAAAHGEAYVAAQAALVNELVEIRGRQQALVEKSASALGLPTRAEVDSLHDAVRMLKDALAELTAAPPAAAPRARPRRAARKRKPP